MHPAISYLFDLEKGFGIGIACGFGVMMGILLFVEFCHIAGWS